MVIAVILSYIMNHSLNVNLSSKIPQVIHGSFHSPKMELKLSCLFMHFRWQQHRKRFFFLLKTSNKQIHNIYKTDFHKASWVKILLNPVFYHLASSAILYHHINSRMTKIQGKIIIKWLLHKPHVLLYGHSL